MPTALEDMRLAVQIACQVLRQSGGFALDAKGSDFNPRALDGNCTRRTHQAFTCCADSPWQIVLLFRQLASYYTHN
jgi:hypothetical protein